MFARRRRRLPIYVYGSAQAGPSDPTHVRPSIFILWFDALGVVCVGRRGRLPCKGRRLHSFRGQAPRLSPRHYYTVHLVVGQHRRLIRTCLVAHWITVLVRNMQEWWNQRTVRVLTVWLTYFRGLDANVSIQHRRLRAPRSNPLHVIRQYTARLLLSRNYKL